MPLSLPFLSNGPLVDITPALIVARTSRLMNVCTFGAWWDRIEIDSRRREVRIRRVRLWAIVRERTIRFDQVAEIAYAMIDGSVGSAFSGERDGPETFDVALTLHSGEEVPLLRFSGEGEYVADVTFPHEILDHAYRQATDVTGDQQQKSLSFVELLCARISVPLGASRYF